jgi:hypothetical protein
MNCPECEARVSYRPSDFDGDAYECATHGFFVISRSSIAAGYERLSARAKKRAFAIARYYATFTPGAVPYIHYAPKA